MAERIAGGVDALAVSDQQVQQRAFAVEPTVETRENDAQRIRQRAFRHFLAQQGEQIFGVGGAADGRFAVGREGAAQGRADRGGEIPR